MDSSFQSFRNKNRDTLSIILTKGMKGSARLLRKYIVKEPLSPRLHCALRSEAKTTTQNGRTTGSNSCLLAFQIKNLDSLKYTTLLGSLRLGLPRFLFGLASTRYQTSINNCWSDPLSCLGPKLIFR